MSAPPGGQERRSPAAVTQPGLNVASPADTDKPSVSRPRRTHPRTGFASAYAPHGRRRQWAVAARCPRCGFTSLHRAPVLAALDGRIRAGSCRHWYQIKVKRTYRGAVQLPDAA